MAMGLKIRLSTSFNTRAVHWSIQRHSSTANGIALFTDFMLLPTHLIITSLLARQCGWTQARCLIPRGICDKWVISLKVALHLSIT